MNIFDMPMGTNYPSQGIEFVVRRSKVPGRVWLMRVSAAAIVAGRPGFMTYPPAAAERATDGWRELHLK